MAKVALPIKNMETNAPIFEGGEAYDPIRPIDIGQLIQAEKDSLEKEEKNYQQENGTNATPSSFDSAERFINTLKHTPDYGIENPAYFAVRHECVGLFAVFACSKFMGITISDHSINMNRGEQSVLLKGLGTQIGITDDDRELTYFCIDDKPFAYIYKGYVVPIKDRTLFSNALSSVPFFNTQTGTFDDILAATAADADNGKLLFKQLLYAFLFKNTNSYNPNGDFLDANYNAVLTYIQSRCSDISYLSIVDIHTTTHTLVNVLMNAPFCGLLPDKLFSEKLLLFRGGEKTPPCFGAVEINAVPYWCVNPVSKVLCDKISRSGGNIDIVRKNNQGNYEIDWEGAPDCNVLEGLVTCKIRLKIQSGVTNEVITVQKRFSEDDYIRKQDNGQNIESIRMGIDRNINPDQTNYSIFNRYIVWKCPSRVSVSFDKTLPQYNITHFKDKAHFAIVNSNTPLPSFAYMNYNDIYCGCLRFPEPEKPQNSNGDSSTVYIDFGTTNTICLVEYGTTLSSVDLKNYVKMITGNDPQFMTYHLLSIDEKRDNNGIVKSIGVCSEENVPNSIDLFFAHPLNAGNDAIDRSIKIIGSNGQVFDLERSVGIYTDLKWEQAVDATTTKKTHCYRALAGSLLSSALAELVIQGYNISQTVIYASYPNSMSKDEQNAIKTRLNNSLRNIDAPRNITVHVNHSESEAAAFYIISELPGMNYNVGIDIGGGSIDLFSFESTTDNGGTTIPAKIDSVKDAAGQKILSYSLIQAIKTYGDDFIESMNPDGDRALSNSLKTISQSSDSAAMCIVETLISDITFADDYHPMILTFRRNVLLRILAVLIYTAEFAKMSWKLDEGDKLNDVSIHLCGNGSRILSTQWVGKEFNDAGIIAFLQSIIGCDSLEITLSSQPKQETVRGMEKMVMNNRIVNQDVRSFERISTSSSLSNRNTDIFVNYIKEMLNNLKNSGIFRFTWDTNINPDNVFFTEIISKVTKRRVDRILAYINNPKNGFINMIEKGDELYKAGVFLRFILDLPFIEK